MTGILHHQLCFEYRSEEGFGWEGDVFIQQDGSVSESAKVRCRRFVLISCFFKWLHVFLFEAEVVYYKSLQLHDFKSHHFQPLNSSIIVITRPRGLSHTTPGELSAL